eukprot:3711356-Pleurochrysis_carterae.AAC.2
MSGLAAMNARPHVNMNGCEKLRMKKDDTWSAQGEAALQHYSIDPWGCGLSYLRRIQHIFTSQLHYLPRARCTCRSVVGIAGLGIAAASACFAACRQCCVQRHDLNVFRARMHTHPCSSQLYARNRAQILDIAHFAHSGRIPAADVEQPSVLKATAHLVHRPEESPIRVPVAPAAARRLGQRAVAAADADVC